ncbi:MAG: hemerythrin domain-containing protein [Acidimicrobiales bacterium]
MPDITDLILDDHETLRRCFAELDELRDAGADALSQVWEPLGLLLDLHAAAEEQVFYPQLLARGQRAEAETTDAIKDHNAIRDAVGAAAQAPVASGKWWQAVKRAREQNSARAVQAGARRRRPPAANRQGPAGLHRRGETMTLPEAQGSDGATPRSAAWRGPFTRWATLTGATGWRGYAARRRAPAGSTISSAAGPTRDGNER